LSAKTARRRPSRLCAARAASLAAALILARSLGCGPGGTELVPAGAEWRYRDGGADPGPGWFGPGFDDAGWSRGGAPLGYGNGDEATELDGGPRGRHYLTAWFRRSFEVADPASVEALDLWLARDDGAVIYLNGTEIARSNMPGGPVDPNTPALEALGGRAESTFVRISVCPARLRAGENLLAAEVHQATPTSSDLRFDLRVVALDSAPPLRLERPPYLQLATPTGVVVRWRTDSVSDTAVRWGPAPDRLDHAAAGATCGTEHEVAIDGLAPGSRTYYAVGTPSETLAGGDGDHFFWTPPPAGSRRPIRIWVVGDEGKCSQSRWRCSRALAVRDAYRHFAGDHPAELMLTLGDNAYDRGSDRQYTEGFFQPFAPVLRATVLWPTPGNHEFGLSDSPSQTGPYYEAFTVPTRGEAGGAPSGTEAYYSFDWGNVHVVSLDSHDTDRSVGGAMHRWLEADLAATRQDWILAVFHHPPYTRAGHDSDDPTDFMRPMRENFVPLLERHGVDLELGGHSHSYERSFLLHGHYGTADSFDPARHALDRGDGDPDGDGSYHKAGPGPAPGTVYAVVGSSSDLGGGPFDHPAMAVGMNELGSLLVDVDGLQLDARFIDATGAVRDHFRIVKGEAAGSSGE
jgi:Calcineurin-like phosphoesterase